MLIDIDALWSYLDKTFKERIVILDGGMGTQLQTYKLQEEDYRGKSNGLREGNESMDLGTETEKVDTEVAAAISSIEETR